MTVKVAEPKIRTEQNPPKKDLKTFSGKITKVLLVGNNPIQLTKYYNLIYNFKFRRFEVGCCFCLSDCLSKMRKFNPDCVLIDDDYPLEEIKALAGKIRTRRNIPVMLLKESVYKELDQLSNFTFIHKENLSSDTLCRSILQTIKEHAEKHNCEGNGTVKGTGITKTISGKENDGRSDSGSSKAKKFYKEREKTEFIRNSGVFMFLKRISSYVKSFFNKLMELSYRFLTA